MAPVSFDLANIASVLPPNGRTLILGCSGESLILAEALHKAGTDLGAMTFTGIFVPGLNRETYLVNEGCHVETFFMTPELKAAGDKVDFFPLCYEDILERLKNIKIDAAIFMVSPPDHRGICSFGCVVDFLAELIEDIPVKIAHINPLMPKTFGYRGIDFSKLTAYIEKEQSLLGMERSKADRSSQNIASYILPLIPNGATLQMGLGKIPGAVLGALTGHKNLKIYSGLISDEVVDLEDAGALADGVAVTAGVAIGSQKLYDAVSRKAYSFQPVSITHGLLHIAKIKDFITLNSALEIDLYGQAFSEIGPRGIMSGPGGASDYARAAKASGGLRIIALNATAAKGKISRIMIPNTGAGGPVSLGRMDIDIIVTEFGAADLRGLGYDAVAQALIAISAPEHRNRLQSDWNIFKEKF